jgi:hypothetical protein
MATTHGWLAVAADTVLGLSAAWAETHPFKDDPERRDYPPDAWNLGIWHSTDNPSHILGPIFDEAAEGMDCECGAAFINPPWMALIGGARSVS